MDANSPAPAAQAQVSTQALAATRGRLCDILSANLHHRPARLQVLALLVAANTLGFTDALDCLTADLVEELADAIDRIECREVRDGRS